MVDDHNISSNELMPVSDYVDVVDAFAVLTRAISYNGPVLSLSIKTKSEAVKRFYYEGASASDILSYLYGKV